MRGLRQFVPSAVAVSCIAGSGSGRVCESEEPLVTDRPDFTESSSSSERASRGVLEVE